VNKKMHKLGDGDDFVACCSVFLNFEGFSPSARGKTPHTNTCPEEGHA